MFVSPLTRSRRSVSPWLSFPRAYSERVVFRLSRVSRVYGRQHLIRGSSGIGVRRFQRSTSQMFPAYSASPFPLVQFSQAFSTRSNRSRPATPSRLSLCSARSSRVSLSVTPIELARPAARSRDGILAFARKAFSLRSFLPAANTDLVRPSADSRSSLAPLDETLKLARPSAGSEKTPFGGIDERTLAPLV